LSDRAAQEAGQKLPLRHSDEIQGDILAGFRKDHATVLLLNFPAEPVRVRDWLGRLVPQIATTQQVARFNADFSTARHTLAGVDPAGLKATWVNLSLTYQGLKFLMGSEPFEGFSSAGIEAFVRGAAASAAVNGDEGESAPENWLFGRAEQPVVHAIITVASDEQGTLERRASELRVAAARAGLTVVFEQNGATLPGDRAGHEHFGFKDGVSQPGVAGFDQPDPRDPVHVDGKPGTRILPAGEFVLGHPRLGPEITMPEWTRDGSFQVVRRLAQDVPGWWAQVAERRKQLDSEGVELPPGTGTEWLAARTVGRWRSGASVAHNPNTEPPTKPGTPDDNLISYVDDREGTTTPHFAHIRKTNPRDGIIADNFTPSDIRRIMRRGIPYGEPFDPASGEGNGPDADRGLVFVAYMADIAFQFEFLQSAWINNDDFLQPETGKDPVIGKDSDVNLTLENQEPKKLHFSQFVHTEGTVYAFAPSLSILRDLAQRS
jgi:Dyp-type peroxidase family